MDFLNIAKQRFSVRSYTDQAVEKEKLDKILEGCPCSSNRRKPPACASDCGAEQRRT